MNIATIITAVVALGSLIMNYIQWHTNKKSVELNIYEKNLEVIEKLQEAKDREYKSALKSKEIEIEQLKKDMINLQQQLQSNTTKLALLQNAVNKLIGGGCKNMHCPNRAPYPLEDLQEILNTESVED